MRGNGKLSRQEKAVTALLQNPTVALAAKACGISEATLYRWMNEPDFQVRYLEARQQLTDTAMGHLQASVGEAVLVLRQVATDKHAPPASRVNAARAILDNALRMRELTERRLELKVQTYSVPQPPEGYDWNTVLMELQQLVEQQTPVEESRNRNPEQE